MRIDLDVANNYRTVWLIAEDDLPGSGPNVFDVSLYAHLAPGHWSSVATQTLSGRKSDGIYDLDGTSFKYLHLVMDTIGSRLGFKEI